MANVKKIVSLGDAVVEAFKHTKPAYRKAAGAARKAAKKGKKAGRKKVAQDVSQNTLLPHLHSDRHKGSTVKVLKETVKLLPGGKEVAQTVTALGPSGVKKVIKSTNKPGFKKLRRKGGSAHVRKYDPKDTKHGFATRGDMEGHAYTLSKKNAKGREMAHPTQPAQNPSQGFVLTSKPKKGKRGKLTAQETHEKDVRMLESAEERMRKLQYAYKNWDNPDVANVRKQYKNSREKLLQDIEEAGEKIGRAQRRIEILSLNKNPGQGVIRHERAHVNLNQDAFRQKVLSMPKKARREYLARMRELRDAPLDSSHGPYREMDQARQQRQIAGFIDDMDALDIPGMTSAERRAAILEEQGLSGIAAMVETAAKRRRDLVRHMGGDLGLDDTNQTLDAWGRYLHEIVARAAEAPARRGPFKSLRNIRRAMINQDAVRGLYSSTPEQAAVHQLMRAPTKALEYSPHAAAGLAGGGYLTYKLLEDD